MENVELREKTEDLQTMLNEAIREKGVMEEQLVVLKEEEQQKIIREEVEEKVKGCEQEREANSNFIQEFSLEVIFLKQFSSL